MKRILLFIECALGLMSTKNVSAQTATFSVPSDTVSGSFSGPGTIPDYITNLTSNTLTLKWGVIASNFPSDWLVDSILGICDDQICRQNTGLALWSNVTNSGGTYTPTYTADTTLEFAMQLNMAPSTVSSGQHYMTVRITDITNGALGAYSKTITFLVNKWPTAVTNISNPESNVVLYPNPATSELNVVYDASADVKNIAVYNIIGKVLTVYKVTENNGANLNIDNLPSGIYFVRLINSHGDVVVTRKFTKQ